MDMKLYKQLEKEFSETHSGSYYPYQKDLWILIRYGQTREDMYLNIMQGMLDLLKETAKDVKP